MTLEGWTTVPIYKAKLIRSDEEEDIPQEKAKSINVPVYKARLVESDEDEKLGAQEVRDEQVH